MQISGDQISAAVTSELIKVVNSNAGSLPVQVENVATGTVLYMYIKVCG